MAERIVEYHIVSFADDEKLEAEVNRLLKQGLEPYGDLIVGRDTPGYTVCVQVMVRREKRKKGESK